MFKMCDIIIHYYSTLGFSFIAIEASLLIQTPPSNLEVGGRVSERIVTRTYQECPSSVNSVINKGKKL